ncbi:MAG: hypothetical protein ACI4WZ_01980 [Eubacteriales bacterium]
MATSSETEPAETSPGSLFAGIRSVSYGISVTNAPEDRTYRYNGGDVSVALTVKCKETNVETGFLLFLDGIPQKYTLHTDNPSHSLSDYVKSLDIKADTEAEVILSFQPSTGKKGEILGLYLMPFHAASWLPSEEAPMFFGQEALHTTPYSLRFEIDGGGESVSMLQLTDRKITEEEYAQYKNGDVNRLDSSQFVYLTAEANGVLRVFDAPTRFTLKLLGGDSRSYKTYLFLNHEPVSIEGKDCISGFLKKGSCQEGGFSLDLRDLPRNSVLYSVTVPCGDSYLNRGVFLDKTRSVLVVNENRLPVGTSVTEASVTETTAVFQEGTSTESTAGTDSPKAETSDSTVPVVTTTIPVPQTTPGADLEKPDPVDNPAAALLEELNRALNEDRYGISGGLGIRSKYDSKSGKLLLFGKGLMSVDLTTGDIVVSDYRDLVPDCRVFVIQNGYAVLSATQPFLPFITEENHCILEYFDKNLNLKSRYDLSELFFRFFETSRFPDHFLKFAINQEGTVFAVRDSDLYLFYPDAGTVKKKEIGKEALPDRFNSIAFSSLALSESEEKLFSVLCAMNSSESVKAIAVMNLDGSDLVLYPDDDYADDSIKPFRGGAIFGSAYRGPSFLTGGSDEYSGVSAILWEDGNKQEFRFEETNESDAPFISPNGSYIAARSTTDGTIRVYETQTGRIITEFTGDNGTILSFFGDTLLLLKKNGRFHLVGF